MVPFMVLLTIAMGHQVFAYKFRYHTLRPDQYNNDRGTWNPSPNADEKWIAEFQPNGYIPANYFGPEYTREGDHWVKRENAMNCGPCGDKLIVIGLHEVRVCNMCDYLRRPRRHIAYVSRKPDASDGTFLEDLGTFIGHRLNCYLKLASPTDTIHFFRLGFPLIGWFLNVPAMPLLHITLLVLSLIFPMPVVDTNNVTMCTNDSATWDLSQLAINKKLRILSPEFDDAFQYPYHNDRRCKNYIEAKEGLCCNLRIAVIGLEPRVQNGLKCDEPCDYLEIESEKFYDKAQHVNHMIDFKGTLQLYFFTNSKNDDYEGFDLHVKCHWCSDEKKGLLIVIIAVSVVLGILVICGCCYCMKKFSPRTNVTGTESTSALPGQTGTSTADLFDTAPVSTFVSDETSKISKRSEAATADLFHTDPVSTYVSDETSTTIPYNT